ncbi:hypothetical protein R3P38DRAFT_2801921 [Favolaschia claudopus]|uniref:Uncharacterized protein n=1 Tax=Favolaschia claudopus TaxID=2862362 RepID=A0AAV9ZWH7_9AGAR
MSVDMGGTLDHTKLCELVGVGGAKNPISDNAVETKQTVQILLSAAEITPMSGDDTQGETSNKAKTVSVLTLSRACTCLPAKVFSALKKKTLESPPSKTQKTSVNGTAGNTHEVVLETDESIKHVTFVFVSLLSCGER